eukprot:gene8343-7383_t
MRAACAVLFCAAAVAGDAETTGRKVEGAVISCPCWPLFCAAHLPAKVEERPVIGIYLGTTSSVVGVEIIANEIGNRITPSVVAFTENERLVGDWAKNQMAQNPENTVYAVKRLIGQKYADTTVQSDKKLLSFNVGQGKDKQPVIEVMLKGETKIYTAEEISAM